MAYMRPLVLSSTGLIEELQAADLLDQSAVIVGPGLTGLTAGQVPYANSTTTVACSPNLTFNGTTLTAAALATGYTTATGGTANTLSGQCIPRSIANPANFVMLDYMDTFAYVDLVGGVTVSPTQSSGSLYYLFRASNVQGNGPTWSLAGTTQVQFVVSPISINVSNYNLSLVLGSNSSLPTNIQIEVWNNTLDGYAGAYQTVYNSAVTITGNTWISPTFSAEGSLPSLGNVRITLTIPDPALGTNFQPVRILCYGQNSAFDPWHLSCDGGSVYGSVALVGTGSNLSVGGTLGVTGTTTLGTANVTTLTMASSGSLTLPSGYSPPSLISANVSFYVTTTGNDTTGNGSSGSPWATLGHALAFLNNYTISPAATVTINIAAGSYTSGSQIPVNHPQGSQIVIVGVVFTTTITGVTSFSAPSGGTATAVLAVGLTTNMVAGDYLLIQVPPTGGSYGYNLCGCHKITTVGSGTSVTVTVNTYAASAHVPTGTTGLTGNITILKTHLIFSGSSGLQLTSSASSFNLGTLANVVLVGPGSGTSYDGIIGGNINCNTAVGLSAWGIGVLSDSGANTSLVQVVCSGCGTGFQITFGSYANLQGAVANGCTSFGVYSTNAATMYGSGLTVVGCNSSGIELLYTASLYGGSMIACDNNGNGITVSYGASAQIGSSNVSYNTAWGVSTTNFSMTAGGSSCTFTSNTSGAATPTVGATGSTTGAYNFS
jgi:hypothetical protein